MYQYKPTKAKVQEVRDHFKAIGIKVNVKQCNACIRVVFPEYEKVPGTLEKMRDFMVSKDYSFAGGSKASREDWHHAFDRYEGRAQFFLYIYRGN